MPQTLLSERSSRSSRSGELSINWIRELAAPYLRAYRARAQRNGELHGFWFVAKGKGKSAMHGFFVGYLVSAGEYEFLNLQPPECLVFAFVHPVKGAEHRQLVAAEKSLVRETFNYIRWLTHRPPRFVFHDDALAALTRHQPMGGWPRDKWEHFSRNFFIETLAWLVRSGLVRKLAEAGASSKSRGIRKS